MDPITEPERLTLDELEGIEKQALRSLFHAVVDFGFDAFEVFYQSPDDVQDIAEDTTREMLDRLGGYQIPQRILGNVDYRKARYVILPNLSVRQALFVDSKAEKEDRTATIQMSQTSMQIRQIRNEREVDESGKLPQVANYGGITYITTTMLARYCYADDAEGRHVLSSVTLAGIPNGKLQSHYNPTAQDTFWLAGRNAPTLGEDFRVRLSYERLKRNAVWRVQRLVYNRNERGIAQRWEE